MPSLNGAVRNINNTRPHRTTLAAGCTLMVVAMLAVTSVVRAYDNQAAYSGYYGTSDENFTGSEYSGGDYAPYPDGGYGGYSAGNGYSTVAQDADGSIAPYQSEEYPIGVVGNDNYTPVDNNGYPASTGGGDNNTPIDNEVAQDNGAPVSGSSNVTQPSEESALPESSPSPSSSSQPVANATAKIVINKPLSNVVMQPVSSSIPAELPTTGLDGGIIAKAVSLTGVTAAAAYYLDSRRELKRTISTR